MTLKQVTLWSWLVKSETKEEFRCPPGVRVTNEEFAVELARQIKANELPAQVELCEVNWDDTNIRQMRTLVRYTGSDSRTDVVRLLVGVDQMGHFAYVERKSCLRPPELLNLPREQKQVPSSQPVSVPDYQEGLGGCLVGLTSLILMAWGIFLTIGHLQSIVTFYSVEMTRILGISSLLIGIVLYIQRRRKNNNAKTEVQAARIDAERKAQIVNLEVETWNKKATEEQQTWEHTWSKWQSEVVQAAYLSKTDDVFGRFTSAISSTVDDVVKVLFIDRDAELRNRTQHAQTQEEIEKELQRRRTEAFN